jgi:hypothetical protein
MAGKSVSLLPVEQWAALMAEKLAVSSAAQMVSATVDKWVYELAERKASRKATWTVEL